MVWCRLDSFGSGQGQMATCSVHSNELSGSIECRKFTVYLHEYKVLKKDSAP